MRQEDGPGVEIRGNEEHRPGECRDSGNQDPTTVTIQTITIRIQDLVEEKEGNISVSGKSSTHFTLDSLISDDDVNVMHLFFV